jgi:hypothetical protein
LPWVFVESAASQSPFQLSVLLLPGVWDWGVSLRIAVLGHVWSHG